MVSRWQFKDRERVFVDDKGSTVFWAMADVYRCHVKK